MNLTPANSETRVAVVGQRSEAARYVDDAPRGRSLQQRQHRLRDSERAEEIGLEGPSDCVETGYARRSIAGTGDPRIVYQDVQPAVICLNVGCSGLDRRWVVEIDPNVTGIDALIPECGRGGIAAIRIPCTYKDMVPALPSWRAISKPMPLLPPVISAIRAVKGCMANSSGEPI